MSAGLISCSLFQLHDCPTADWEKLGTHNARKGYPKEYVETLAGSCSKPPPADYREKYAGGFARGTQDYCKPSYFYYLGKMDQSAPAQNCPEAQRAELTQSHERGKELHWLLDKRETLRRDLAAIGEEHADPESTPKGRRLAEDLRDVERKIESEQR